MEGDSVAVWPAPPRAVVRSWKRLLAVADAKVGFPADLVHRDRDLDAIAARGFRNQGVVFPGIELRLGFRAHLLGAHRQVNLEVLALALADLAHHCAVYFNQPGMGIFVLCVLEDFLVSDRQQFMDDVRLESLDPLDWKLASLLVDPNLVFFSRFRCLGFRAQGSVCHLIGIFGARSAHGMHLDASLP